MKSSARLGLLFGLLALVCLLCVMIVAGANLLPTLKAQIRMSGLKDKPAPDFSLPDLDGKQVSLGDFRGRTVLVNFWATWCPACRQEMPGLIATYKKNKGSFVVLAISEEDEATVRSYARNNGIGFPLLLDGDGAAANRYGINVLPTSILVNKEGTVVQVFYGSVTGDELERALRDSK